MGIKACILDFRIYILKLFMMTEKEFLDRCISFSIKINKLRKYLREKQHEYNNSDQIQRSGTSIGANYSEACNAESKADFIHKLGVAQKEAYETIYWLKVLYGSELITQEQYDNLMADVETIHKILSASIKTAKEQSIKSI
jgi:four helix bundle protein